jgi:hypothetical protein
MIAYSDSVFDSDQVRALNFLLTQLIFNFLKRDSPLCLARSKRDFRDSSKISEGGKKGIGACGRKIEFGGFFFFSALVYYFPFSCFSRGQEVLDEKWLSSKYKKVRKSQQEELQKIISAGFASSGALQSFYSALIHGTWLPFPGGRRRMEGERREEGRKEEGATGNDGVLVSSSSSSSSSPSAPFLLSLLSPLPP